MNGAILKAVAGFSVGCLGLASAANATVIASTDFSTDTAGTLNGQGGGTGWYGNWASGGGTATVTTGSLAQPSGTTVVPSGNSAVFNSANGGSLFSGRTFGSSAAAPITTTSLTALGDSSDTVYFSWIVQRNDSNDNHSVFDLLMTGATFASATVAQVGVGVSAGDQNWAMFNTAGYSTLSTSSIPSTTSSTFMVVSLNLSTGLLNLYVDPQGSAIPAIASASATLMTGASGISVSSIQPFAESSGGVTTSASYGNIVVGTTYADVVPTPEPSSLALLSAPVAALLARRRRRSALA